jgi:hypothetical protein
MTFALDLQRFRSKTAGKANTLVRYVLLNVGGSLVFKSPVGDADYWISKPPPGYVGGRFRANWQYGEGSINETITEDTHGEDFGGYEEAAEGVGLVGKLPQQAAGKRHFLTNSLPYGPRLEDGWSKQAPNGMVNLTVLEFQPLVDRIAEKLNNE